MQTSELDYTLPDGLIATEPARPRENARLLVVRMSEPGKLEHLHIRDLPELLSPNDLLITNQTTVMRARFVGVRDTSDGHVSGLYLGQADDQTDSSMQEKCLWRMLLRMKRAQAGKSFRLVDRNEERSAITVHLLEKLHDEAGGWVVEVRESDAPIAAVRTIELLGSLGRTPLPPYILASRRSHKPDVHGDDQRDLDDYSTVFQSHTGTKTDAAAAGSVAAPTAGLHFTDTLLDALARRGVNQTSVTLHVNTGTFRTIETDTLEAHRMHAEWCSMDQRSIGTLRECTGRRIAVGTTSVRTIESYAAHIASHNTVPESLTTRLLISPGYPFQWTDALLTNFHLPRSTLLALVAALLPGSIEQLKDIYAVAIEKKYRFYSFGDAMLALP